MSTGKTASVNAGSLESCTTVVHFIAELRSPSPPTPPWLEMAEVIHLLLYVLVTFSSLTGAPGLNCLHAVFAE